MNALAQMTGVPAMEVRIPAFASDDDKWAAVLSRDPAADGLFLYAVRTTGVYCRPTCAARAAKRGNVSFHLSCEEAEQAGFRPCLRCRPTDEPLAKRQADAVARACRMIETAEEPPQLDELAQAAGMSRFHFHRLFKSVTGLTPKAFVDAHRAERVRQELKRSCRITDAIYEAGFNSNGRFYAQSTRVLGMTPTDYRAGGTRATIRFAVAECSLGSILVAASDAGVCAILMGDDPDTLVRDLQDRFPRANLTGGDEPFQDWVARIIRFVEAPRIGLDLPLDIRGTAFQQRVWRALSEIPPGSTASYAEIAAKIGAPKAVRAVAQACAANSLAVVIPCHRVVRHDGALSGYRWGAKRKLALLEREKVA